MTLWLCLRLPRLPLESLCIPTPAAEGCLRPPADAFVVRQSAAALVVFERRGSRKTVLTVNDRAAALGVAEGETLSAATALAPQLQAYERSPRAEREALQAIAGAAYRFSGQVSTQATAPLPASPAVWLEISASAHLFGGAAKLTRELRENLALLGYGSEAGMAATPEAAYLLNNAAPVADEAAALRKRPVRDLPLAGEIVAALQSSGVKTVGNLLNIPSDALARRFGMEFMDYLGRLTGRLPDARRWYRPPERFQRRFALAGGAESSEALRFPIKRLLSELVSYLTARDTGVQSCRFEFGHEQREPTPLIVNFSSPTRDFSHLQVVINAQLERLSVPAMVEEITLGAEHFASPRILQFDLFRERSAEEAEWQAVMDRLCARLGPDAVFGLGLHPDHRPEKSCVRVPVGTRPATGPQAERPLWLLPEPRLLSGLPRCIRGPERLESGWWEGLDAQRDYFVAEAADSARLWVFRNRASDQWYLHGLWA